MSNMQHISTLKMHSNPSKQLRTTLTRNVSAMRSLVPSKQLPDHWSRCACCRFHRCSRCWWHPESRKRPGRGCWRRRSACCWAHCCQWRRWSAWRWRGSRVRCQQARHPWWAHRRPSRLASTPGRLGGGCGTRGQGSRRTTMRRMTRNPSHQQ